MDDLADPFQFPHRFPGDRWQWEVRDGVLLVARRESRDERDEPDQARVNRQMSAAVDRVAAQFGLRSREEIMRATGLRSREEIMRATGFPPDGETGPTDVAPTAGHEAPGQPPTT